MRSRAWSRAAQEFSAPAWIYPSPKGPKRSPPAAQSPSPCSFDVLYLLPQFFDFRLDLQRQPGDRQRFVFYAWRFGQKRVRFAMHFLEQKIQLFPQLAGSIQKFRKLLQMAPQPV